MHGTIEVVEAGRATVVVLHGEHDLATTLDGTNLGARIEESFDDVCPVVIVDLSNAEFIDSTVLAAILTGHRHHQREPGHTFALVVVPGSGSARLIRLAALSGVVPIFPTRESALDELVTVPED